MTATFWNGSGFSPEFCATRTFKAAEAGKLEISIVRLKENAALH